MDFYKNITPKLIAQIEKATGLIFIKDGVAEGNVCYANNAALRPEFKSSFRKSDVEDYIMGLFQLHNTQKITLPKDASTFWKIARFKNS